MQPSNPIVLDRLYEAIDMAKEGNINCCAIVMVTHNGCVVDAWANGTQPFVIIGALEALKRDFMDTYIENRN